MIPQMPILVFSLLPLLSLLTSVSSSCIHGTHLLPRQSETVPIHTFGYSGANGPLNWACLNEAANANCSLGRFQSPINIDSSIKLDQGTSSTLSIPDVEEAEFMNLGTTVEVVVNGTLVDRGKEYTLEQFHFHTPSEHRIFGEYQIMEVHFVFEAKGESSPAIWTSSSLTLHVPPPLSNTNALSLARLVFARRRLPRPHLRPIRSRPPSPLHLRRPARHPQPGIRHHHGPALLRPAGEPLRPAPFLPLRGLVDDAALLGGRRVVGRGGTVAGGRAGAAGIEERRRV